MRRECQAILTLWRTAIAIALFSSLAGCGFERWETSYNDLVSRAQTRAWSASHVDVIVPPNLSVSDLNLFAPNADIVWHGEPYGDRRAQVRRILEVSALRASRRLKGQRAVRIEIELEQFHALSDRARLIAPSAVHNIQFKVRVFDAKTGRQIIPTDRIRADLPAYTGKRALQALRRGETQKVRITRHLETVLIGWLQQGPDPRMKFGGFGL